MEITDIRIFAVDDEKLRAFVTIVIDGCFVVSDIKIIHGHQGLFISMPSKRRKNGTYRDLAHPLNSETRQMLEERILGHYEQLLASGHAPKKVRRPRELEEIEQEYYQEPMQSPAFPPRGPEPPGP
jgi:stage V sporulation protein G